MPPPTVSYARFRMDGYSVRVMLEDAHVPAPLGSPLPTSSSASPPFPPPSFPLFLSTRFTILLHSTPRGQEYRSGSRLLVQSMLIRTFYAVTTYCTLVRIVVVVVVVVILVVFVVFVFFFVVVFVIVVVVVVEVVYFSCADAIC